MVDSSAGESTATTGHIPDGDDMSNKNAEIQLFKQTAANMLAAAASSRREAIALVFGLGEYARNTENA